MNKIKYVILVSLLITPIKPASRPHSCTRKSPELSLTQITIAELDEDEEPDGRLLAPRIVRYGHQALDTIEEFGELDRCSHTQCSACGFYLTNYCMAADYRNTTQRCPICKDNGKSITSEDLYAHIRNTLHHFHVCEQINTEPSFNFLEYYFSQTPIRISKHLIEINKEGLLQTSLLHEAAADAGTDGNALATEFILRLFIANKIDLNISAKGRFRQPSTAEAIASFYDNTDFISLLRKYEGILEELSKRKSERGF